MRAPALDQLRVLEEDAQTSHGGDDEAPPAVQEAALEHEHLYEAHRRPQQQLRDGAPLVSRVTPVGDLPRGAVHLDEVGVSLPDARATPARTSRSRHSGDQPQWSIHAPRQKVRRFSS